MLSDVQMALNDQSAQVVDARSAGRFAGREPEPRAGLRSGHMPGALSVPFTEIVENGRLASPERIAQAFKKAGVDTDKPVITSCGSGVTAAILTFGLEALGKKPGRVYDGSCGVPSKLVRCKDLVQFPNSSAARDPSGGNGRSLWPLSYAIAPSCAASQNDQLAGSRG